MTRKEAEHDFSPYKFLDIKKAPKEGVDRSLESRALSTVRRRNLKRSFIPSLKLITVHTNPSGNAFQTGGIKSAGFSFYCG